MVPSKLKRSSFCSSSTVTDWFFSDYVLYHAAMFMLKYIYLRPVEVHMQQDLEQTKGRLIKKSGLQAHPGGQGLIKHKHS